MKKKAPAVTLPQVVLVLAAVLPLRAFDTQLALDVHFISLLPVMQRLACKAWADKRPVHIVWAVRYTRPDHAAVEVAFGCMV